MGAEASRETNKRVDDQGLGFFLQYLPEAAKPLDWDDLEHVHANTLKNRAMLEDKTGTSSLLETIKAARTKSRHWKAFQRKGSHCRNVSWAAALDVQSTQ